MTGALSGRPPRRRWGGDRSRGASWLPVPPRGVGPFPVCLGAAPCGLGRGLGPLGLELGRRRGGCLLCSRGVQGREKWSFVRGRAWNGPIRGFKAKTRRGWGRGGILVARKSAVALCTRRGLVGIFLFMKG